MKKLLFPKARLPGFAGRCVIDTCLESTETASGGFSDGSSGSLYGTLNCRNITEDLKRKKGYFDTIRPDLFRNGEFRRCQKINYYH